MERVDCVVVGAGVVGLAVARALALAGREVIVLDAAEAIGTGNIVAQQRGDPRRHLLPGRQPDGTVLRRRTQGAVHLLRQEGRAARELRQAHCSDQRRRGRDAGLGLKRRADANGVEGMRVLNAAEAIAMEPNLSCTSALLSPVTGIIDSHAFMLALQGDAENAGATPVFLCPVTGGRVVQGGVEIDVGGVDPMTLRCRLLVNSAGLHAPGFAAQIAGMPHDRIPPACYAKGNYFTLSGRSPFSRLIYPVPVPGGLGVHLTIDLGGQARFGPDVQWISAIHYTVDPARADGFYAAVRKYWPALKDGALQPGYAGIRPKIVPRGAPAQDFVVQVAEPWRARADQSVRHRKPGPDRVTGAGGSRGGGRCHWLKVFASILDGRLT